VTRPRVVVVDPVDPEAIEQLHLEYEVTVSIRPDPDRLAALLTDADAVIVRSGVQITAPIID
jgi:D-3-phosphoglycerate dehydrogenase / 2-oxoglutarate reductase